MGTMHHKKHGQKLHRPLGAYELYELEHMPREIAKLPTDRPNMPHTHEALKPDNYYYGTGREMQQRYWSPRGGGDGENSMPAYNYEMEQPYWRQPEGNDGGISEENIDAEAEDFIRSEHEKFELSKWMSMKAK